MPIEWKSSSILSCLCNIIIIKQKHIKKWLLRCADHHASFLIRILTGVTVKMKMAVIITPFSTGGTLNLVSVLTIFKKFDQ